MLLPNCINLSISLAFLSSYSLYLIRFSKWPHAIHVFEQEIGKDDLIQHLNETAFKDLEWGYQSDAKILKVCAADTLNHAPFNYKSEADLDMYLRFPTAINMSKRFTFLIQSGFIISLLSSYFYLTYAFQSTQELRMKHVGRNVRWYCLLSIFSLLHLYLMIYWRLYLKQGRICAGDYIGRKSH